MPPKEPVLLVVTVQTSQLRWFVAALGLGGEVLPLLRSETGDLDHYLTLGFDDQVSFLRHRFCGVLQRGCDRLWPRQKKACQVAIVFERPLEAGGDLTHRVAEHFVQWMANPPVAVLIDEHGFAPGTSPELRTLEGSMERPLRELLDRTFPAVLSAMDDEDAWELSPKKVRQGGSS